MALGTDLTAWPQVLISLRSRRPGQSARLWVPSRLGVALGLLTMWPDPPSRLSHRPSCWPGSPRGGGVVGRCHLPGVVEEVRLPQLTWLAGAPAGMVGFPLEPVPRFTARRKASW